MLYIQYNTHNIYEEVIRQAIFDFQICPVNSVQHSVENIEIKNSFSKNHIFYQNRHGFDMARISIQEPFTEFYLSLNAAVNIRKYEPMLIDKLPVDAQREILGSDELQINFHDFLEQTNLIKLKMDQLSGSLTLGDEEGIFSYSQRINNEISSLINYNPGWTDTTTTAKESLERGKGVCQDFSHIMLSILRANGVPARYVSGYLYTFDGGGDENSQLHAWVEAYVPGNGWTGFDPANGLVANEHYVKISHGIDYSECSPIKGVLAGPGANTTWHEVKISEEKISPSSQQQQ